MTSNHELPFGAEIATDGVRFSLRAPAATSVSLALEGGATLPMEKAPEGRFELTTGAARAGSRYRYVVDGTAVPDPASRYQPEDVHGPSEVIDPRGYAWQDGAWQGRPWSEIVLYELHVGSFSETGTFAGVASKLDHLVALGITAIELMPVAEFPGKRNWGYDGVLLFAPDAAYGRPDDLRRLVDACHARGIAIFLDVVYNHFGPDGNYLSVYQPDFFTEKHHTPWGAAVNFDGEDSGPVRDFYIENALYWLEEFHFDGLRFDAVHAIIDNGTPHILAEIAAAVHQQFADRRTIHLILENDNNEAWPLVREGNHAALYTAQWNDDVHHALHVVASGESGGYYADYAEAPMRRLGRALAEGFAFQGEASHYRDGARRGQRSAQLPPTAFVSFIQNHDQVGNNAFGTRLGRVAPADKLRLVIAVYLLSPQIPMLFMGEEWGAAQPFTYFGDFNDDLADKVREGRRKEFSRFPEFQDEKARENIPDPSAVASFESARLDWSALRRASHAEWLEFYRGLIAIRRRAIAPLLATAPGNGGRFDILGDAALRVRWRLGGGTLLTLLGNFGGTPVTLAEAPQGRLLHATGSLDGSLELPALTVAFFLEEGSRA